MLEAMIRSPKTEHGIVERARIVLLAAQGRSTRSIASELGTWPGRVSRWRTRFSAQRLAGLHDLPRPGAARRYGNDSDKRILASAPTQTLPTSHNPCAPVLAGVLQEALLVNSGGLFATCCRSACSLMSKPSSRGPAGVRPESSQGGGAGFPDSRLKSLWNRHRSRPPPRWTRVHRLDFRLAGRSAAGRTRPAARAGRTPG